LTFYDAIKCGGFKLLQRIRKGYKILLESIVIVLMLTLTVIIVLAVIYRKAGASFSWSDEVAAILLAWLTYYGAALAALQRGHIGFKGLMNSLSPQWRIPLMILGESLIIGFFILLAWVGFQVLQILEGDYMTSLTWVPTQLTQSVIPIGATMFVISELFALPELWAQAKSDEGFMDKEDKEVQETIGTRAVKSEGGEEK
jgi:TRAP-type C4-dicarboxylate transport system permease small subunit